MCVHVACVRARGADVSSRDEEHTPQRDFDAALEAAVSRRTGSCGRVRDDKTCGDRGRL